MSPELLVGLIAGLAPCVIVLLVHVFALAGRLARIETDICWLIKELKGSFLRGKDRNT